MINLKKVNKSCVAAVILAMCLMTSGCGSQNYTTNSKNTSYGRRLLGLKFKPSLALSSPLNLPAPGRRQPIYLTFRFRIDLCFC